MAKIVGIIVVVLIIIGGAWYLLKGSATPTPAPTSTEATSTGATGPSTTGTAAKVVISYTDSGFSPATVSIAEGQTVTFVNNSSHPMWVASGVHPTHAVYDGTSKDTHCAAGYTGPAPFDECGTAGLGESYTFTFTKAGTFSYHNHALASASGTIVVTAPTTASTTVNVTL